MRLLSIRKEKSEWGEGEGEKGKGKKDRKAV